MGMGYQSISQMKTRPFFQTVSHLAVIIDLGVAADLSFVLSRTSSRQAQLVQQGQIASPQFSFKLGATGSSELYLGGMNPSSFIAGSTQWTNVVSQSYWVVSSTANVNGLPSLKFNAIVDSGTSVIVAPTKSASSFWATVPDSAPYGGGYYAYPCDAPPNISFSFAGSTKQWSIAAENLNLGRVASGSSRCVGAIVGADVGVSAWILGDTLFKSAYITFDLGSNRVGFSTMK